MTAIATGVFFFLSSLRVIAIGSGRGAMWTHDGTMPLPSSDRSMAPVFAKHVYMCVPTTFTRLISGEDARDLLACLLDAQHQQRPGNKRASRDQIFYNM